VPFCAGAARCPSSGIPSRWEPVFFEDCEKHFIPVAAVLENVLLESAFLLVAALLAVSDTTRVERNRPGTDLVQVECVERIVEEQHFRFAAVAFFPVASVADHGARRRAAVLPVDAMEAHRADRLTRRLIHNNENDISILSSVEPLEPRGLGGLAHGYGRLEKPRHSLVVDPASEVGEVVLCGGGDRDAVRRGTPRRSYLYCYDNGVLAIVIALLLLLFHGIILSRCEFAGALAVAKMKTSASSSRGGLNLFGRGIFTGRMIQAIADRHKRKDARHNACVQELHIRDKSFTCHI